MFEIWSAAFVMAIALAVVTYMAYGDRHRSNILLAICLGLMLLVIVTGFATYPIAHSISKASAVGGYVQSLNGSVVSADVEVITCTKEKQEYGGSNCARTELCDPYWVTVIETYTDSKGNPQTRSRTEVRYYDCPLMTKEYTYSITAVAYRTYNFTIADHIFGAESRYIQGNPAGVPNTVPPEWQRAKDALAAGSTLPVTVPDTYDNFILGSEAKEAKDYSGDIQRLLDARLLPEHTVLPTDASVARYRADKMTFVGMQPSDAAAWQDALMRYNAAFGSIKQGDVHIVAIKASVLPPGMSPEGYTRSLKAYWQNYLGKNAFPKNAVALVLAVDDSGRTVEWARATTGMPLGNGIMENLLMLRLGGAPFSIDKIFGSTGVTVSQNGNAYKVAYQPGSGILPTVMITDADSAFKRACMSCSDEGEQDQAGYVGLEDLIPISTAGIIWSIVIDVFIGLLLAAGAMYLHYGLTGHLPKFMQRHGSGNNPFDRYGFHSPDYHRTHRR